MYDAIDNIKGVEMETRRQMKKKLAENLAATISKIDKSTATIAAEVQ